MLPLFCLGKSAEDKEADDDDQPKRGAAWRLGTRRRRRRLDLQQLGRHCLHR